MNIAFNALQETDLPLLHQWFQEPLVKKWYARDRDFSLEEISKKYTPRILGKDKVQSFIVTANAIPIGFIQYYVLNDYLPEGIGEQNSLFHLAKPHQIAGIDFFISNSLFHRQGWGTKILQQFITLFLESKFRLLVADPEINNHMAVHFYQHNGFTLTTYSENPHYLLLSKITQDF
jgi:aminoglycoside 6'-N-acetyltransferase